MTAEQLLRQLRNYWQVPAHKRALDIEHLEWNTKELRDRVLHLQEKNMQNRRAYFRLTGFDWQDPAGPNGGQ